VSDKKEESQPSTLSEAEAERALAKAEYEAAKEEAKDAKPVDGTLRTTTISDAVDTSEGIAQAEAAYEAAKAKVKAAREELLFIFKLVLILSLPLLKKILFFNSSSRVEGIVGLFFVNFSFIS